MMLMSFRSGVFLASSASLCGKKCSQLASSTCSCSSFLKKRKRGPYLMAAPPKSFRMASEVRQTSARPSISASSRALARGSLGRWRATKSCACCVLHEEGRVGLLVNVVARSLVCCTSSEVAEMLWLLSEPRLYTPLLKLSVGRTTRLARPAPSR